MKSRILIFCFLSLVLAVSCGFEETVVTNIIHEDGSLTRIVKAKHDEKPPLDEESFELLAIPVDSTWLLEREWKFETADDSVNKDTTWYLMAEKHFENAEELNNTYQYDLGVNRNLNRGVALNKSFRWFTTVYRYSEKIERVMDIDYPMSNYLSDQELEFAYWPSLIQSTALNGKDSALYKNISASVTENTLNWAAACLIKYWMNSLYKLIEDDPKMPYGFEEFVVKEEQVIRLVIEEELDFFGDDDLVIEKALGRQFVDLYRSEIDSAQQLMEEKSLYFLESSGYDIQAAMPGKIFATNGYLARVDLELDSVGVLWTVDPALFLVEDYEMWVESRVHNYWLWVVTAIFLAFVTLGLIRKGKRQIA